MQNGTTNTRQSKARKPYDGFPLFAHSNGQWAKKIRGRLHYFGPWNDPDGALQRYLAERDDLHAGRTARIQRDGLTVGALCNSFLTSRQRKLDAGELRYRTWSDYYRTCEGLVKTFGRDCLVDDLAAEDFSVLRAKVARRRGAVALGNEVQRVRTIFKYAYDAGLIERPVRFGPDFVKPSRRVIRLAKRSRPVRMFEAAEIRQLLEAAPAKLRAMILLGINCGWGNTDVAELPITALALGKGMADYPRPKTGIPRQSPLWPETIQAIRIVLAERKAPREEADSALLFITLHGNRYVAGKATDGIGLEFGKLLRRQGLYRLGRNFYSLRHTFRTIADEVGDRPAIDLIMGHENADDIATGYRHGISDERLRRVTDHVRAWLWPAKADGPTVPAVPAEDEKPLP